MAIPLGAVPAMVDIDDERPKVSFFETCYAFVGICYYEQGIVHALRAGRGEQVIKPGETDIFSTLTQLFVLCGLVVFLTLRRRQLPPLLKHMLPYVAIVGLCLSSALWSDLPFQSFRRGVSLSTCVMLGVYLYITFGFERTVYMAGFCTVVLGVLSVMVYFAVPSVGHEIAQGYENAMRGVFPQKNPMCQNMVLALACFAFRIVDQRRIGLLNAGCVLILLLCLAMGRSASSMMCALVMLSVAGYMYLEDNKRLRLVLVFLGLWVVLSVVTILLVTPELVAEASGRDASLTGRVPLWQQVIGVIAQRPLLGYGYAGFWNRDSIVVQYIWYLVQWEPPDSHNGYLDILVQIGFVGFAFYMWLWSRVLRQAWAANRERGMRMARWVLLFMVVNFTLNLDEGPLPSPDAFTMLMPGALIAMGVWTERYRTGRALARWSAGAQLMRYRPATPARTA